MKGIIKNWKTTVSGLATIATGVVMIANGKVAEGVTAIITGAGLILAKDHNQTGNGQ